jgi:hypothetical protein
MIKKISLLALGLCVAAPLACGGGGGGGVGGDFCAKFASATCMKTISCPDPNAPLPPNFTMANCVQAFTKLCTDKPPANQIPDVNCYGATHVNTAAQAMCLSAVSAATCDQVNNQVPLPWDDICAMVCTAAATTGGAGSTGAAGTGSGAAGMSGSAGTTGSGAAGTTGAGGTAPAPADAASFCKQLSSVDCDQAYKCVAPADRDATFIANEGSSITECKGTITTMNCAMFPAMCTTYNSLFAQACVNKYAAMTCDDIALNGLPLECSFACQ